MPRARARARASSSCYSLPNACVFTPKVERFVLPLTCTLHCSLFVYTCRIFISFSNEILRSDANTPIPCCYLTRRARRCFAYLLRCNFPQVLITDRADTSDTSRFLFVSRALSCANRNFYVLRLGRSQSARRLLIFPSPSLLRFPLSRSRRNKTLSAGLPYHCAKVIALTYRNESACSMILRCAARFGSFRAIVRFKRQLEYHI